MLNSQSGTELCLEAGDILYREGDAVDYGYIVASGELILYSERSGERFNWEKRGAGSMVGELSILKNEVRSVTVEAVGTCRIYRISAQQILHRYDKLDPILRTCIETALGFVGRLNSAVANQEKNVPFSDSILRNSDELIEKIKFEHDILNGIENDDFYLNFQPIVRLEDGELLGVEALMRWQHPTLGNIPPGRFIEVAENMGAICKLTDIALMKACAALKRLLSLGACRNDLFVTINVSGQDIGRPEFFDFLVHVLDLNDLDPNNVKLELTETSLMLNSKPVTETLDRLRSYGLGVAIDDFGTGYSNLAYLKEIPLTALKIDRAFAGDAHNNPISRSIVKMIVCLGHELGVRVVAEGLETEEDVQTLREIGCDLAQGYYFSKPVPEAGIAEMIAPSDNAKRQVA